MNKINTPLHNIDINHKTYSLIRLMGRTGNSRPGRWLDGILTTPGDMVEAKRKVLPINPRILEYDKYLDI
jgi:hypothetical protein